MVHAIKKWRHYIEGCQIEVVTDHSALQWLFNIREPQGRVARWVTAVQAIGPFSVKHRAGRVHQNGDSLSRPPFVGAIDISWEERPTILELKNDMEFAWIVQYLTQEENAGDLTGA